MGSYTYGESPYGYDQRWSDKDGTTTTRLNVARKMCDALREWLDDFMDTTSASAFGTWENPFNLGGTSGYYLWWDATTGCAREKVGSAPSSETDGIEKGGGVI